MGSDVGDLNAWRASEARDAGESTDAERVLASAEALKERAKKALVRLNSDIVHAEATVVRLKNQRLQLEAIVGKED